MDYFKINNLIFREYNLKSQNNIYNLRVESIDDDIFFIVKNIYTLVYVYKNKIKISSLINSLNFKLSNLNIVSIFKRFDQIYTNKKILINNIDEDTLKLKIENSNISENGKFEIKLKKENMNINDKIDILYNEINLMKNTNKNSDKDNNFENIQIDMNKKEDDIKNIINELVLNTNNKI